MNDVFLQSIVEKLEALEIALLKRDNAGTIRMLNALIFGS
jgi:hypothetical protein